MCGRFLLRTAPESWPLSLFDELDGEWLDERSLASSFVPRANVSPTQKVLAILCHDSGAPRRLKSLRWGLIPSWAKDRKMGASMINARSETVHEKPSFRTAFLRRRCLIPADGYYEWVQAAGRKQPMRIERPDQSLFCFAGLWERNVHLPADKDGPLDPQHPLETCTIITTAANASMRPIHDRMPVVIEPEHYQQWLDPGYQEVPVLQSWLQSADLDYFVVEPVEKVSGV